MLSKPGLWVGWALRGGVDGNSHGTWSMGQNGEMITFLELARMVDRPIGKMVVLQGSASLSIPGTSFCK